jgi:hypothetical protein
LIMRKLFTATFAATVLLGAWAARPAAGEETKPALVVSFAGYDQLLQNVNTIGKLAGQPAADTMVDGLIAMCTGGNGLAGLDKARPWGLAVFAGEDGNNRVQGYIPVSDLKKLVSVLPPLPGASAPLAPDADGVYEIAGGNGTVYIAQKGKWALLADSRDGLKPLSADPAALLGSLSKKYLLAVRADVKNVPAAVRNKLLSQVKTLLDLTSQKNPDESEEEFALRSKVAKQNLHQLGTVCKELDGLTLGLSIDPRTRAINLDMEMTALPGTNMAKQLASAANATTSFAGFRLPGAALTAISVGAHTDADAAEAKETLTALQAHAVRVIEGKEDLDKERQDLLKQCIGDVMDVVKKTLDTKKSDGGMAVLLDGHPTLVAGAAVADGAKLEKTIKRLLGDPKLAALIKVEAEKREDVDFHVVTLPVSDPQAAAVFGKQVEIVVGCGSDAIYVGAGKDSLKVLKQAIDGSQKAQDKIVPAFQVELGGAPIARFIARVATDADAKKMAEKLARALAKAKGKDHLTLTSGSVPNGVSMRLSVDEGITKAIVGAANPMSADTSSDHATGSNSSGK